MSDERAENTEEPDEESAEQRAERIRRRDAAMSRIVQFGDPLLKSRASEIHDFGDRLAAEAAEMVELMRDAWGVGLAATQVGRLRRLLVFEPTGEGGPTALVNPEVEWLAEETDLMAEGCLSIPGISVEVERPVAGRFRGFDTSGESVLLELEGLPARIIQHEIDHLDGVLILDRTSPEHRKAALGALRRGETWSPPEPDGEATEEALA
jgi:peptide deformylase